MNYNTIHLHRICVKKNTQLYFKQVRFTINKIYIANKTLILFHFDFRLKKKNINLTNVSKKYLKTSNLKKKGAKYILAPSSILFHWLHKL